MVYYMNKKSRKIYIGVAWPYVNEVFHIGNLTGAYLPPDIFARFHRLKGNTVLMVSGSDFHGTPITLRADKDGKKPEKIAQHFHELDKKYLAQFRIDYDLYTSTHTENHRKITQEMFLKLLENEYITIQETKQLYSKTSRRFLQDRYVEGECPYCHASDARGDQCEQCGRLLDALELLNPISKLDKSELLRKRTQNYFLNLSKLQEPIKKWLESNEKLRPWVKREALGWIKEGLHERAITRDMDYGVPLPIDQIPKDKLIENIESKVFYVWFEAVIGYLSAAIEYSQQIGKPNYWKEFFYDKEGETYYFVGQDNLVFHTINWPAQLIAYEKKINLPTNVLVNKFLQLEGQKMSKSRNWFIETPYLLENYSVDSIRFYLTHNMPEQKVSNFSWEDFLRVNNGILVGTIGNFVHRSISLAQQSFGNEIELDVPDVTLTKEVQDCFQTTGKHLDAGEFRMAIERVVRFCELGNQYIDRAKPWKLIKEDTGAARAALSNLLWRVDALCVLLYPFLPSASERLNTLLGYKKELPIKEGYDNWVCGTFPKKITIAPDFQPLFPKIPEERIKEESSKLGR